MDIVDCHIHAAVSGNYHENIQRLIRHMLQNGIGKAVISDLGDGWKAFPDTDTLMVANNRLRKECISSDGRLEYLVYINPQLPDWKSIFDKFITDSCGVKLWISLWTPQSGLERTKDVLRAAAEHGKAVLIHTFEKTDKTSIGDIGISGIIELARAVPSCRIVAAHAGGNWRKTISRASEIPENVVFDISGGYPERTMVSRLLDAFGSDRILYGSDAYGRSFSSQLNKLHNCGANAGELTKMLCSNSMKIFSLTEVKPVPPQQISAWKVPGMTVDNFCFTGKGRYWDHSVTPAELVREAKLNNVDVLYAASLEALTAEDKNAANFRHKKECEEYVQIRPLAVADLQNKSETLFILDNAEAFAGILISPYLHGYKLEYEKYAYFFDVCSSRNIPVWINTALSDDRFRDAGLKTRCVSVDEIIGFVAQSPKCSYVFQGCPADVRLSKNLPEWCSFECSKLSDSEYAPEDMFENGSPERLCFGSEYPFRDYGSVKAVLSGNGGRVFS